MNVYQNTSRSLCFALALALPLAACGGGSLVRTAQRLAPTNGSTMVITPDDEIALSVQRDANTVSVFHISSPGVAASLSEPTIVPMPTMPDGQASEPWAAVIDADGNTAYVILRRAQQVVQITDLHGTPTVHAQAATGSEPTGIAITPSGNRLYIANWNDGTITRVDTATMTVSDTISLNVALAASGMLGENVTPRPALAHPRGIVITDHGNRDDDEETAYVTEFFSQARTDAVPLDTTIGSPNPNIPRYDVGRQGVVYAVALGTRDVTIRTVPPVEETGMQDTNGEITGCIPNQLQAPTLHGSDLYIASMCASPQGPTDAVGDPNTPDVRNFRTLVQTVIFVMDTNPSGHPVTHRALASEFMDLYRGLPGGFDDNPDPNNLGFTCDGAHSRVPLIATDITFAPGREEFFVTAYGSNAVFRVALAHDGVPQSVGGGVHNYVELVVDDGATSTHQNVGRLPTGMVIGVQHTDMALVSNDATRNVSLVDLISQAATGSFRATIDPQTVPPAEAEHRQARMQFVTGTGRWAYHAQGWSSCESCHPDGLTDNVTWFFKRGPRQTPSLAGTYGSDGSRRYMSWTASFDEVQDLESITRGLQGGVGSFVFRANNSPGAVNHAAANGDRLIFAATSTGTEPTGPNATMHASDFLNGTSAAVSMSESVLHFYDGIRAYVQGIRAPRRPTGLSASAITRGRDVFVGRGCVGCHGTARWTISEVIPPTQERNGLDGTLRHTTYMLPSNFPPAVNPIADASRTALFRYPDATHAIGNDEMYCALRAVGTYNTTPMLQGRAAVLVNEVRHDMTTPAQGTEGFNPPAIVGVSAGAPYFHAGNARTLEEMLADPAFLTHANAFAGSTPSPWSDDERAALVAYLASIDDDTAPVMPDPAVLGFDPDLCAQALR